MDEDAFRLNPALDADRLADDFSRSRRLHIPNFLAAEGAEWLYQSLKAEESWKLVINQEDKAFELDRSAQAALSPEQREQLDLAVHKSARYGFQFRFESIRVSDSRAERAASATLLNRFAAFLSSEPVLALVRRITGADDISFADAQGTAYGLGHFLTAHDDEVAGKSRRAAYVFNLTPSWRPDWGGLLLFHGADGHIEQGYSPSFNALNIFAVPQPHSVSMVTPFAARRRYSVTGWLRAGEQPG
jgi:Rps23 Pro-64 3,4-dihydroxylase Tpa1-like proline 4-hydroxylase